MFVDQFTEAAVHDRARMELSKKVQVVHDPAITALGAKFRHKVRVDVHLRDGSVHSETREAPRAGFVSIRSAPCTRSASPERSRPD